MNNYSGMSCKDALPTPEEGITAKFIPLENVPLIGNFTYDSKWGKNITVPTNLYTTWATPQ